MVFYALLEALKQVQILSFAVFCVFLTAIWLCPFTLFFVSLFKDFGKAFVGFEIFLFLKTGLSLLIK